MLVAAQHRQMTTILGMKTYFLRRICATALGGLEPSLEIVLFLLRLFQLLEEKLRQQPN